VANVDLSVGSVDGREFCANLAADLHQRKVLQSVYRVVVALQLFSGRASKTLWQVCDELVSAVVIDQVSELCWKKNVSISSKTQHGIY
jgi:hypothetical protein